MADLLHDICSLLAIAAFIVMVATWLPVLA